MTQALTVIFSVVGACVFIAGLFIACVLSLSVLVVRIEKWKESISKIASQETRYRIALLFDVDSHLFDADKPTQMLLAAYARQLYSSESTGSWIHADWLKNCAAAADAATCPEENGGSQ